MIFRLLFLSVLGLPAVVFAHHARVYFTDEVLEIEGQLTGIEWTNPHPAMTVDVTDASGQTTAWSLEVSGSLYPLRRQGVTEELFEIGQTVRVAGNVSTRAENELLATNILLDDEQEVLLQVGANAVPYWGQQNTVGAEGWVAEDDDLVDAIGEARGLFRVWSPPGPEAAGDTGSTRFFPFTEAAIAARSSWDPLDNFAMRCEQPGMPFVMMTPHPIELIESDDEITLRGEAWDLVRTIHVDGNPEGHAPSQHGYSVGRWEGDSLVVETTRINWPYFDPIGTPQSEDVEMIERFTMSEDQARMNYHLTVRDPGTFTEPATYERVYVALGESLPIYDCQLR